MITASAVKMIVNIKLSRLSMLVTQGSSNWGYLSIAKHIVFRIITKIMVESKYGFIKME